MESPVKFLRSLFPRDVDYNNALLVIDMFMDRIPIRPILFRSSGNNGVTLFIKFVQHLNNKCYYNLNYLLSKKNNENFGDLPQGILLISELDDENKLFTKNLYDTIKSHLVICHSYGHNYEFLNEYDPVIVNFNVTFTSHAAEFNEFLQPADIFLADKLENLAHLYKQNIVV